MKKLKKVVSLAIAATMITSSLGLTFSANAAKAPEAAKVSAASGDAAIQSNVGDGVILHAFNWSYNAIKQNLPAIAAAGYSTVQTSPVQQPKDYGPYNDVEGQWWKLYQPVSEQIAQNSWLGTKSDLTSLCAEADKYGIKIICDIVANHMGNEIEENPNSLSPQIKTYQPDFYNNQSTYFHSYTNSASDSSVQGVVHGHVSNCPDVNTSNSAVQTAITNLLKECIDCGVDGFRFDAAKHIETPNDGSYASQFWPNVTSNANNYYKQKTGKNLFMYGEILNTCGAGRSYSAYTPYLSVTDNLTGDNTLYGVVNNNASTASNPTYKSGVAASKVVLWAESHDTYEGDSGSLIKNTKSVSDENIIKTWALVASRKDSTALYFVRPGSALMGQAGTNTAYKSTAVAEINKFHNKFVGAAEKVGNSNGFAYVQRGTSGIVITKLGNATDTVNITGTTMANGTYVDTVSGNKFTVSNGTVTGKIGSTGVAVVYNGTTTPRNTVSVESGDFEGETMTVTLGLSNATSGTYCLDDSTPVAYTGSVTIRIGSDYNYDETINLTVTATNGTDKTSATYSYTKKKPSSSGVYFVVDPSTRASWAKPFNAYIYDEDTDATYTYANASWPGEAMKLDTKTGYYYIEVPDSVCIKSDKSNNVSEANYNLAKSPNTYCIVNSGKLQYPSDGSKTKLKLNGKSMLLGNGGSTKWVETDFKPYVPVVDATNVTKGNSPQPSTDATQSTTVKPQPTTEKPQPTTGVSPTRLYGDVDGNGKITVEDATLIQKHVVKLTTLTNEQLLVADVSENEKISVIDATMIQKYLIGDANHGRVGQPFGKVEPSTSATQSTTAPSTTVPSTTVQSTTAPKPTDPVNTETFYVPNKVGWLTDLGGKMWVYNNSTQEPVIMDYDATGNYFYTELPDTWTDIAIYRTPYETTMEEFDINKPWDDKTQSGVILNKWVNLGSRGSNNAYIITSDGVGQFGNFDPNNVTNNKVTFTNSQKWSGTISCYFWSDTDTTMTGWPGVKMNSEGTNGYGEAVYSVEVPDAATYIIFTNGTLQTVDIPYAGGEVKYYAKATKDSKGHYEVATWE